MPSNTLQYNTAVTIFFIPYTLLEVPSNIILKKMKPSHWMAILMFSWGTVMTLMGIVSSYGGLLAGRFFLGVTEVSRLVQPGDGTTLTRLSRRASSQQQPFYSPFGTVDSSCNAAWPSFTSQHHSLVPFRVFWHTAFSSLTDAQDWVAGNGSSSSRGSSLLHSVCSSGRSSPTAQRLRHS